jgi:uncharacterized protein YjgD (DUF1641 family)
MLSKLRNYVSKNKSAHARITYLNRILHCAVNKDENVPSIIHRWENFWIYMDTIAFETFANTNLEHIPEDAQDFVDTTLKAEFKEKDLDKLLENLLDMTETDLASSVPDCYIRAKIEQFGTLIEEKQKIQIRKALNALHAIMDELHPMSDLYGDMYLSVIFFDALLESKKAATLDIDQEFIDFWNDLLPENGMNAVISRAIQRAYIYVEEAKKLVREENETPSEENPSDDNT